MNKKNFDDFIKSRVILLVSLSSEEHDGAVMITPTGDQIPLDHENDFSYLNGNFTVSDDATALFIYDGEFWIEQLESGRFLVRIESKAYSSDNLKYIEKILFNWID